jgi:hypothetical protein
VVSNFCGKLKVLAELCCYHNFLGFTFMARLCSLDCSQLIVIVARISPLNWDFLDWIAGVSPLNWDFLNCSELMIKVLFARIPFIRTIPGCMALVSTIKAKVVSQSMFLFFFGYFLMSGSV